MQDWAATGTCRRDDWVEAEYLRIGERVRTRDGSARLLSTSLIEEPQWVYNLEVQSDHEYYAGILGLLVHNAGGCGPSGGRSNPPPPNPKAIGTPHTIIERKGPNGQYTTHNGDGTFKQYRGSGQDHGNVPRPNVKENTLNTAPDGRKFPGKTNVRPARPDEIPGEGAG